MPVIVWLYPPGRKLRLVARDGTRYSRDMRRIPFIAFILAAAGAFAFSWTPTPTIQVESASLGGLSSLSVRCDVRGAAVWLDYQVRGSVPLDLTGLAPGTHLLVIRADGYYDAAVTLSLAADTKTTVSASLQVKTGFLEARVQPPQAKVIIDDAAYSQGLIEVPAGQRTVVVRAFGYVEQSFSIYIPERMVSYLSVELQKAPFEAAGFALPRSRFNPRNSGLKGVARVSFSVSAPGYADFAVLGPNGERIYEESSGPFTDWEQSFDWDGRGGDGQPVPDGAYSVELTVRPEPGIETLRDQYVFSSGLEVDSTLIVVPSGAYGAMYGSVYAPDAFSPCVDGFRIAAFGWADGSVDGSSVSGGVTLSAAGSLERGFDGGIGLELRGDETAAATLGLRAAAPLRGPFGLSAVAEGRLSDAAAGNPAYARLGAALGLGSRFLNVALMPSIGAYWEDGASARAGLGGSLTVSGYAVGASLSAAMLSESLSDGFSAAWPLRTALELNLAPAGLPIAFSLTAGVDWSPEPTAWRAGLGISGGF